LFTGGKVKTGAAVFVGGNVFFAEDDVGVFVDGVDVGLLVRGDVGLAVGVDEESLVGGDVFAVGFTVGVEVRLGFGVPDVLGPFGLCDLFLGGDVGYDLFM
jgi:hypothetical protein